MNNVGRFLSKREKDGSGHRRGKSRDKSSEKKPRPGSNEGFISNLFKNDSPKKVVDKEAANQVGQLEASGGRSLMAEKIEKATAVRSRLSRYGYYKVEESQITFALNSKHARGDPDKAAELLVLFQEAVDGIIRPYNPSIHMKGAENRAAVTCYLDSVLFSMFARLSSFEPILFNTFEDEARLRLSTLIRLWVNMLRTGLLIPIDVTELIQEALKDCGWQEAALCEQQDASEAFSFITETLKLPLLTLKVDIFHTGAEDAKDDHKFIEERLLEVAVPDEAGPSGITLEDCLENYFNNRVEVRRHLARSNTLSSIRSGKDAEEEKEEGTSQHVEVTELAWSTPNTPISATLPSTPLTPLARLRTASIIRQRVIEEGSEEPGRSSKPDLGRAQSMRKGSARKEVLMPAWQFFNLLPWYNKTTPVSNDAEVASHFTKTRPVLGICLKRYGMTEDCTPVRKNTFIDIPPDTKVPNFVEDDDAAENGPSLGNFKLSLQSVICHRGNSVNAGHYISFIRADSQVSDGDIESDQRLSDNDEPPNYSPERWLRHDDMSNPKVSYVADIKQALKEEMPYLLFYQVLPVIDISPPPGPLPPSYADSGVAMKANSSSPTASAQSSPPTRASYFDGTSTPTIRLSCELDRASEPRQSLSLLDESRRGSMAITEASLASTVSHTTGSIVTASAPVTPNEESTAQRMSRAAHRLTKSGTKSRPTSSSGENRLSATLSRTINLMKSNSNLNRPEGSKSDSTGADTAKDTSLSIEVPKSARQSMEDNTLRPVEESKIGRSKSKGGKSRDKGKGSSSDKSEQENRHHHLHHKSKGKETDGPDRECTVM